MDERDLRERLRDLVAHPNESLDVELKAWLDLGDKLHAARLAKEAMALANRGGGFILIGFNDKGVPRQPAEPRPDNLGLYNQDAVNSIVNQYAEPGFHCSVEFVEHPETGDLFPAVVVPAGPTPYVRAKSNGPNQEIIRIGEVYIRAPGPVTKRAETAQEWNDLHARCERNADLHEDPQREPEPLPLSESRRVPATRDELLTRTTTRQKSLLNAIWTFYREQQAWIPCVQLSRQFHGKISKAEIQAALDALPKPMVCQNTHDGTKRCSLTFAGILLADQGGEAEPLLVRYLEYMRDRFLGEEGIDEIQSEDVSAALGLTPDQTRLLGQVLGGSPFHSGGGGFGGDKWNARLPWDVDDLTEAEDVGTFLWDRALRGVA